MANDEQRRGWTSHADALVSAYRETGSIYGRARGRRVDGRTGEATENPGPPDFPGWSDAERRFVETLSMFVSDQRIRLAAVRRFARERLPYYSREPRARRAIGRLYRDLGATKGRKRLDELREAAVVFALHEYLIPARNKLGARYRKNPRGLVVRERPALAFDLADEFRAWLAARSLAALSDMLTAEVGARSRAEARPARDVFDPPAATADGANLSEYERQVVDLFAADADRTAGEVAAMLGRTPDGIRRAKARALRKIG